MKMSRRLKKLQGIKKKKVSSMENNPVDEGFVEISGYTQTNISKFTASVLSVIVIAILLGLTAINMYIYNRSEANYTYVKQQMEGFKVSLEQNKSMAENISSIIIENNTRASKAYEYIKNDLMQGRQNNAEMKEILKRIDRNVYVIIHRDAGLAAIANSEYIARDLSGLKSAISDKYNANIYTGPPPFPPPPPESLAQ